MLVGIIVLSLFAFAHAQSEPYVEYANAIDSMEIQLKQQILSMDHDIPGIMDSRRHYALLLTHIAVVANQLAYTCVKSYKEAYLVLLPESVIFALTNAQAIVDETAAAISLVQDDTKKIRSLMNTLCPAGENSDVCDEIVTQAVRGDDKRYLFESQVMSNAASVAKWMYDNHWVEVADKYEAVKYLILKMHDLESGIRNLASLIRLVQHLPPCSD